MDLLLKTLNRFNEITLELSYGTMQDSYPSKDKQVSGKERWSPECQWWGGESPQARRSSSEQWDGKAIPLKRDFCSTTVTTILLE